MYVCDFTLQSHNSCIKKNVLNKVLFCDLTCLTKDYQKLLEVV